MTQFFEKHYSPALECTHTNSTRKKNWYYSYSQTASAIIKPWPLNGAIYGEKHVSVERIAFTKIAKFKIKPVYNIALNLLVSLFRCLVARCCRKRGNRQTDRLTDRQTNLRTKYRNPLCACAPRVNNWAFYRFQVK